MSECKQHEKCTKNITKNETNIENQEKNIDKLFDLFRDVKTGLDEFKLEVQAGFSEVLACIKQEETDTDKKILGLRVGVLKILLYIASGGGIVKGIEKLF
jgi:hypothetical protein